VSSHTNVRGVARPEHDRAVSALLRPGNAAANDIADHVAVLDAAIAALPEEIAAGHRPHDDASLVRRQVQVRIDHRAERAIQRRV
jgi:hypothetical protein